MGGQVDAPLDAGRGRVEERGELIRGLGVDGGGRLVDLDVAGAGLDQPLELGGEDGHEGAGGCDAVGIDLARPVRQAARQREGSWQRDLDGSARPRPGVLELLDDAQAIGRADVLVHREAMLLIVTGRHPAVALVPALETPLR